MIHMYFAIIERKLKRYNSCLIRLCKQIFSASLFIITAKTFCDG